MISLDWPSILKVHNALQDTMLLYNGAYFKFCFMKYVSCGGEYKRNKESSDGIRCRVHAMTLKLRLGKPKLHQF